MLDVDEFYNRIKIYPKLDSYEDEFSKFWQRKLKIENAKKHILDEINIDITHEKLCDMIGKWKAIRGKYHIKGWRERLKDSLEKMTDSYNQIRKYSLLEFSAVPQEPLKLIWDEFGRVKEESGDRNPEGNYYVVFITKPLMFLWGQTFALDSYVKDFMPLPDISKKEVKETKWSFETWKKAMEVSSDFLKRNPALIDLSKKISIEKYGTDSIVPYGRFLDIYYWIGGTPYEKIYAMGYTAKERLP